MSRNFGIPRVTSRATVINQPRGSHIGADTTRANNVIHLACHRETDAANPEPASAVYSMSSARSLGTGQESQASIQLAAANIPPRTRLNSLGFGREFFIKHEQPVIEPYELGSGALLGFILVSTSVLLLFFYVSCELLLIGV